MNMWNLLFGSPDSVVPTWIAVVVFALLIVLLWAASRLVSVPAGHVVVTRTLHGAYARILKQGYHVLMPLEGVASFHWTFPTQDYDVDSLEGSALRVEGVEQIDLQPFEVETSDDYMGLVDTLLTWRVSDPEKAMKAAHDPLNLLCQELTSAIASEVVQYRKSSVARSKGDIVRKACETIARQWTPVFGLEIMSCKVQSINWDPNALERHRALKLGMGVHDVARIEKNRALAAGNRRVIVQEDNSD